MNIAFVTEMGFMGKVPRNHQNMRTEFAWMCALGADHYNFRSIPDKLYDLVIVILPKTNLDVWIKESILEKFRKVGKKFAIMQEGPHWYFQDYDVYTQFWLFNALSSTDLLLVHNQRDKEYYEGITSHPNVRVMPSLMIEDSILDGLCDPELRNGKMIGGNFVSWYGGFDSHIVSMNFDGQAYCPSMGRKQSHEDSIDSIKYLPYMSWVDWIKNLSHRKIGIHLIRTHAAGTFALNCAYLGIPCIGYKGLDTQERCHPDLTVDVADIRSANKKATELNDPTIYRHLSEKCRELYVKNYSETVYLTYMRDHVFSSLN